VTLDRNDDIRLAEEDADLADLRTEATDTEQMTDEEADETAEIRAEIEDTRLEMGGTLNELGDRLDPGNLMDQKKQ
jgi:Ran GTPase-activating protein (RanGAP) involved in mRNA processing and transport